MPGRDFTATMRLLRPHPSVYAFYDGRVEGHRLFSADANWIDDGNSRAYLLAWMMTAKS